MKSIIQQDKSRCLLCGMSANGDYLEEHHVYGGANRKLSEKYGLKVYLHGCRCHRLGKESVHQNAEVNKRLKAFAQGKAMAKYEWNKEDFIKIFGKSYI